MTEAASPSGSPAERYHFLLRRLHSLAGLMPVGVFVVVHLTVNATILGGGEAFQTAVDGIHLLERLRVLYAVEIFGIFLPILFHAVLGVQIWLTSKPNASTYRYGGNIRYTLQRMTGLIAFAFIIYHVWQMHWLGAPFGGSHFDPENAPATAAGVLNSALWIKPLYAVGVAATVFHLANGVWTALITWGITIGPRSQRVAGYACTAFGIALGLAGIGSINGFARFKDVVGAAHADAESAASHKVSAVPGASRSSRGD